MNNLFLTRSDGTRVHYVYEKRACTAAVEQAPVAVVYLHGLLSSLNSQKGQAVYAFAEKNKLDFVALDYVAHGQSSGQPCDFRIGQCFKDVCDVIEATLGSEQAFVVVGSSMGGWLALLIAKHFKQRVRGILGIAAAPDFMPAVWKHLLTEEHRVYLKNGGILGPSEATKGYCFSYEMFQDANQYLVLNEPIDYYGKVILLQGDKDESVAPDIPFKIKDALDATDVDIHILKGCNHRFSEQRHLDAVVRELSNLYQHIKG